MLVISTNTVIPLICLKKQSKKSLLPLLNYHLFTKVTSPEKKKKSGRPSHLLQRSLSRSPSPPTVPPVHPGRGWTRNQRNWRRRGGAAGSSATCPGGSGDLNFFWEKKVKKKKTVGFIESGWLQPSFGSPFHVVLTSKRGNWIKGSLSTQATLGWDGLFGGIMVMSYFNVAAYH